MKTTLINSLCLILFWLLLPIQVNTQEAIFKPKLLKNSSFPGSTPWIVINPNFGDLNQLNATINWVEASKNSYEFILELSNSYCYFTNSIGFARINYKNTNNIRSFDILNFQHLKISKTIMEK